MPLTSSWAAPLCTEWMFSFRLCWGWRERGVRGIDPMAQLRPQQQAPSSGGAQASTPRTFPTPALLTRGLEKLICISLSRSLRL